MNRMDGGKHGLSRVLWPVVALIVGLALFGAACGDDDGGGSEADRQEVEEIIRQLVGSGPEDVDFFLDHVTDNVLETFFSQTREECRQNAQECVGDPGTLESIENLEVSGDSAEADVLVDFGDFHMTLVREDDTWKLDELEGIAAEIPEGVTAVDLTLDEFSFEFDAGEITDGNIAFDIHNDGDQPHEVIVARVPADLDLEEAVQSEAEPEGVEDIAFQGPISSGGDSTVVFEAPLDPGRYALVCFLPDTDDPERTPHAVKGMVTDFTVP